MIAAIAAGSPGSISAAAVSWAVADSEKARQNVEKNMANFMCMSPEGVSEFNTIGEAGHDATVVAI
jgi:hypothetical protein